MSEKLSIPDEKLYRYSLYKAGTKIFSQGDKGNDIFILKRGAVTVTVDGQIVGLINTHNTVIGEMAYFLGWDRTATVEAVEDSEFIVIPFESFNEIIMKNPDFGIEILKVLSIRLANTTKYATMLEKEVKHYRNELRKLKDKSEAKGMSIEEELVSHGLVKVDELKDCYEELKKRQEDGEDVSLWKILIDKNYISQEELLQYLELKQLI